jgi:hypothetical protein
MPTVQTSRGLESDVGSIASLLHGPEAESWDDDMIQPVETAYYYPEPYWLMRDRNWVKTLLLFFDEVAILLPDYMLGRHRAADPSLVEPLEDKGLLRILHPEWFVDTELTERMTETLVDLITGGAFDHLPADESFAELSMSRMGYGAAEDLARMVYDELEKRGLARPTEDGVSIPMHWRIRAVYLLLLAQLAREAGRRHGFDLHPATNTDGASEVLGSFFNLKPMPSRGQVVSFDLETVSIDLDAVPLDDVLGFRRENADSYRRYATELRSFALQLSLVDELERDRMLTDRRAAIEEEARELTGRVRKAFKTPNRVTGFGLGLAGAAWLLATAHPVPAALGLLGTITRMVPEKNVGTVYSYLFEAHRKLG